MTVECVQLRKICFNETNDHLGCSTAWNIQILNMQYASIKQWPMKVFNCVKYNSIKQMKDCVKCTKYKTCAIRINYTMNVECVQLC